MELRARLWKGAPAVVVHDPTMVEEERLVRLAVLCPTTVARRGQRARKVGVRVRREGRPTQGWTAGFDAELLVLLGKQLPRVALDLLDLRIAQQRAEHNWRRVGCCTLRS